MKEEVRLPTQLCEVVKDCKELGKFKSATGLYACKKHKRYLLPRKTALQPYIDHDYWHKLTKDERKWLNQFDDEYYYGNLSKVTPLHKKKKHTENMEAEVYSRRASVPIQIAERAFPENPATAAPSPEDAYIEYLDAQKNRRNSE